MPSVFLSLCPLCYSPSSLRTSAHSVPLRYLLLSSSFLFFPLFFLSSCSHPRSDPTTVVFVIESNPANLDPRFGSDAQSQRLSALLVSQRPGTNFDYLGINMEDRILSKRKVRQALAYATDRDSLIKFLLHDEARKANSLLPPNHWAYDSTTRQYNYDPAQAEKLLDTAGYPRQSDGTRLHVTLKISTVEQARLIGAALQDQWKKIGIALEVRPLEIATLFAHLAKGSFQISYLRWVGANNDPDVFELVFSSKRIPPDGPNRGRYRSARMDALTDQIRVEMDREKRKQLCHQAQQLAAEDLPYVPLWYPDVVSVHAKRLGDLPLSPTGDYQFLSAP